MRLILALDPSSVVIGYAIFKTTPPKSPAQATPSSFADAIRQRNAMGPALEEAGKISPTRATDDANTRIYSMGIELAKLIREHSPDQIVIEDTSGKVHRSGRGRGMNGAGLAIYGKAVGYFLCVCRISAIPTTAALENIWTGGSHKATRAKMVAAKYAGRYDAAKDKGMDISDAIALGEWFIHHEQAAVRQ